MELLEELHKAYKCPYCKKIYEHEDDATVCRDSCGVRHASLKKAKEYREQEEALALQEAQKEARKIVQNPLIQLLAKNGFCDKAKNELAVGICNFIEQFLPRFPNRVLTDEESPWEIGYKEIEALRDTHFDPA